MELTPELLEKLEQTIKQKNTTLVQTETRLETLTDTIKADFGTTNQKELKVKILDLEAEVEKLIPELDTLATQIKEALDGTDIPSR